MKDYSQHGESAFIRSLFPHDFRGLVLEIGAYSPKHLSNSRLFIEEGWRAVLVEPSPGPLRALVQEYGHNPNVSIYSCAVGSSDLFGVSQFDISDGPLSTNIEAAREFWKFDATFMGKLMVPVYPPHFFAAMQPDFVSIDTQGNSIDVALEFLNCNRLAGRQQPKVICIERQQPDKALFDAICIDYGYEIMHHEPSAGVNRILRRKE